MGSSVFVPTCHCGVKGAERCPDHQSQKLTTPRRLRNIKPVDRRVACEQCGTKNGQLRKSYRLDPRNWRERYRLLCTPCQKALGFTPVDHARVSVEGTRLRERPVVDRKAA